MVYLLILFKFKCAKILLWYIVDSVQILVRFIIIFAVCSKITGNYENFKSVTKICFLNKVFKGAKTYIDANAKLKQELFYLLFKYKTGQN